MRVRLAAIVVLGVIEVTALLLGINGTVMSLSVAAIAGLGGYTIGVKRAP